MDLLKECKLVGPFSKHEKAQKTVPQCYAKSLETRIAMAKDAIKLDIPPGLALTSNTFASLLHLSYFQLIYYTSC